MTSYTAYIQKLLGDTGNYLNPDAIASSAPRSKRLENICSRLLRSRMMMMMMMCAMSTKIRLSYSVYDFIIP